ncbi:MAG: undecaprenyl-diphosphate phosphatase [Candidatus Peregrinibacteria bacterium]|nr:undecaprenyl-diphosphate phosphatase [Candidatus Peregrinibacteria bacterium]
MNIFEHIFLGVLQGFTEFLPVSSSGHLYLAQKFLGFVPDLTLEIFFHAGSLVAVVVFFKEDVWRIFKSTCSLDCLKKKDGVLGVKLLLATILTVPVALLLESKFELVLNVKLVAAMLLITGIMILIAEKFRPKIEKDLTWGIVIALGLVQGIAALPGISRSGITIAFLILVGVNRRKAAEYSFILSIPTILGAVVFAFNDASFDFSIGKVLGFVICVLASLVAIKWMIKLVEKHWIWFAPYCFLLGASLLLIK